MSKAKKTKTKPATKPATTTTVDIVVRLQIAGSPADIAKYRSAISCLADIMRVQAEDGLWTLGYEDAELDDVPNEYVADIEHSIVHSILIGDRKRKQSRGRFAALPRLAPDAVEGDF